MGLKIGYITDEIILKIDVSEFEKNFGNYIRDNILVWSKVLRGLDINIFKKKIGRINTLQ